MDWYEAWAELGGARVKLQVFLTLSRATAGGFHRAYFRAAQQAFLGAHELGFEYFGGVVRRLRYDNLAPVKKIARGFRREETARFITHW